MEKLANDIMAYFHKWYIVSAENLGVLRQHLQKSGHDFYKDKLTSDQFGEVLTRLIQENKLEIFIRKGQSLYLRHVLKTK